MHIGFIGAGKMAEAMMGALLRRQAISPDQLIAIDIDPERLRQISRLFPIRTAADPAEALRFAPILVLAVKPQQLPDLLESLAPSMTADRLVLSIAAGKPLAFYETAWPAARLVRIMPNVACLVGEAMSVYALGRNATPADRETVESLLGCFGQFCALPEIHFDAVTALSGSGPAFIAYLADRLVAAAVEEGLPAESARLLAAQTLLGTARLLLAGVYPSPRALMEAVTSARGTTAAGREILESSDVGEVLRQTLHAAAQRSRELSRPPS
jgi:pyrroline-5-carboxylate reductase